MKKFLTTAPLIKKIRSGEWEELAICGNLNPMTVRVNVKCYRLAGTTATYTQDLTFTIKRLSFPVACPQGETFTALTKIEVWLTIYNTTTHQYDQVTEIRTYLIDVSARKKPTRIGWLNTLGGIDYYTFTGARMSETASQRSEFVRDLPVDFSIQDRSSSVLTAAYREEIEVISDFETEDTFRWLSTVFASPEVWVVENSIVIPVMVTSSGITVETDDLIQAKLKFRKSNELMAQYG